jgi:hypothetical protein
MQRLSITTSVFVPDYARYEVYSIQPFVIQFISGLLQVKSVALRGYTNESDSNNATFSCSNKSNRHYALSSCSNKGTSTIHRFPVTIYVRVMVLPIPHQCKLSPRYIVFSLQIKVTTIILDFPAKIPMAATILGFPVALKVPMI